MITRAFYLILSAIVFTLMSFMPSATQQDIYTSIESAIAVGNAERLSEFMSTSMELEIPGQEEEIYSQAQAIIVLKRFFDSHPPVSFNLTYKGNSGAGLRIAIGNYLSTDEMTFRVKILLKKVDSRYLIQEIEFE